MKYIIVDDNGETPFLFPNYIGHDDMAFWVGADRSAIVGAGFVEIYEGKCLCTGMSTSLEIASRPEDSHLINKFMSQR